MTTYIPDSLSHACICVDFPTGKFLFNHFLFLHKFNSLEFLQGGGYQPPGSGRARRDAAARAMQGWHSQRLLGYGEVAEPIIKVC